VTADQASITIRVPSERMDEALETIKEGATEVRNENVTSDDVTQEFTDLESRLRNLQAAEEQLLDIMNNAEKTEDVLSVFNQLTQIRAEIEVIQGRIQYLSESARLSAISVDLIPDVAAQPLEIGGWRPEGTVKEAFTALIQGLRFLGNAAIYVLICGLPIGLILGVPGFFASRAMRRRRAAAKRKATPTKD
jgi:TolA-binding protein